MYEVKKHANELFWRGFPDAPGLENRSVGPAQKRCTAAEKTGKINAVS
jgi:hypothetical protein